MIIKFAYWLDDQLNMGWLPGVFMATMVVTQIVARILFEAFQSNVEMLAVADACMWISLAAICFIVAVVATSVVLMPLMWLHERREDRRHAA